MLAGTPASSKRSASDSAAAASNRGVKPKSRLTPFSVWAPR